MNGCLTTKRKNKFGIGKDRIAELVNSFRRKERYVVHARMLRLYMKLGLIVTKIYRVLEFKESCWLKKYIDFNTSMRAKAENDFDKNFFKLMNNSVFGKTMGNVRKRVNIEVINSEDKYLECVSRPTFSDGEKINDNLFLVRKIKSCLKLDKPSYIGMSILDLSKSLMYDFHYNYFVKKFGIENIKLLFTDTDSLCYSVKCRDIYESLLEDRELFDNADYDKKSPFFFSNNKKVIGKMKDETSGKPISVPRCIRLNTTRK